VITRLSSLRQSNLLGLSLVSTLPPINELYWEGSEKKIIYWNTAEVAVVMSRLFPVSLCKCCVWLPMQTCDQLNFLYHEKTCEAEAIKLLVMEFRCSRAGCQSSFDNFQKLEPSYQRKAWLVSTGLPKGWLRFYCYVSNRVTAKGSSKQIPLAFYSHTVSRSWLQSRDKIPDLRHISPISPSSINGRN